MPIEVAVIFAVLVAALVVIYSCPLPKKQQPIIKLRWFTGAPRSFKHPEYDSFVHAEKSLWAKLGIWYVVSCNSKLYVYGEEDSIAFYKDFSQLREALLWCIKNQPRKS